MGKAGKKSATKVEAKPVSTAPVKSIKKGKRDAKDDIEKQLNAKKQKKDATVVQVVQEEKAEEASGSDSPDSEEEQQEPVVPAQKPVATKNGKAAPPAKNAKPASNDQSMSEGDEESEGSEEDDESDDDEQPTNEKVDDGSSEESEEDEESEDEKVTPNKKPNTPVAQTQEGSKTLFVGNLSYKVERSDIEQFFQDAGEIVDVRIAASDDGRFKGFGHVEFVSAEAAKKALKLNGKDLLGREVKLDLARERGAQTPQSGNTQNGGKGQSQTVFVKGFDSSAGEDEIKTALREHFGSCGEITRISVPTDRDTGAVKGIAYLDMSDSDAHSKALELNGSDMGGDQLTVDEAKPRDSGGRGGRSGGRGGRSGGRGGGGRFSGGRGRGRGGSGGRRGRGSW